jgi:hypothetical protein
MVILSPKDGVLVLFELQRRTLSQFELQLTKRYGSALSTFAGFFQPFAQYFLAVLALNINMFTPFVIVDRIRCL